MDKKRPITNREKRISQLQERKKQIETLSKEKERKKRTNRLIQKGALLEKYFECEHLTPEETEELLKVFSDYVNHKKPDKFKNNF